MIAPIVYAAITVSFPVRCVNQTILLLFLVNVQLAISHEGKTNAETVGKQDAEEKREGGSGENSIMRNEV